MSIIRFMRTRKAANSRALQRRYRDHDRHRRNRSRDKYREDEYYRSSRRDRSRERRKSRDRDAVKDHRQRSRDRDSRSYRDDSRDRARRRREESADSRRKGRREDSRTRPPRSARKEVWALARQPNEDTSLTISIKQAPPTPAQTDEAKKAERLAKLEAWKQKQAAEKDRKQKELESSGGTRTLLAEIDKKSQDTSVVPSPQSPAAPVENESPVSPIPYAGKFDPKAIAKKAAASSSNVSKLGTDIALPGIAKTSATNKTNVNGLKVNTYATSGM